MICSRMDVQQKKDVAQKALEEFKSSNHGYGEQEGDSGQGAARVSHSGGVLLLTFITYFT